MSKFIQDLRRRNIFRVAGVYAVVGWLLIQLGIALETSLNLPAWFDTLLTTLVLVGFPVAMILAWAFEMTPDGVKRTETVRSEDSITEGTGRKLDYAIAAGLLVLIAVTVGGSFLRSSSSDTVTDSALLSVGASESSIAVMPFANMSSDPEQEYFSDGISEEILNLLAQVPGMDVAGRTSSFAFKNDNRDLREIGDILDVAHVLEGSVRKSGSTIRITAQLIKVEDGFHLWSNTYDRELTDIFAIQDEISAAILTELGEHIPAMALAAVNRKPTATADIDAYDLFLLARDKINQTTTLTAFQDAIVLLDQSIELDEDYAPALALRGYAEGMMWQFSGFQAPVEDVIRDVKVFTDRAIASDLESAEAMFAIGYHHVLLRDQAEGISAKSEHSEIALEYFRKAVSIRSNFSLAQVWVADLLMRKVERAEALDVLETLLARDPGHASANGLYIAQLAFLGRFDDAYRALDSWARIKPDLPQPKYMKAGLLNEQGRLADAWRELDKIEVNQDTRSMLLEARLDISVALANGPWIENNREEITQSPERQFHLAASAALNLGDIDGAASIAKDGLDTLPFKDHWGLSQYLYYAGHWSEIVDLYDATWPTKDAALDYWNSPPLNILHVLQSSDHPHFTTLLNAYEKSTLKEKESGSQSSGYALRVALLAVFKGDDETAVTEFMRAMDLGWRHKLYTNREYVALIPDGAEYDAVLDRMKKLINEERVKLGLEPL